MASSAKQAEIVLALRQKHQLDCLLRADGPPRSTYYCYEIYGLKRTGCVCCPLSSRFKDELEIAERYEPGVFQAAKTVFSESYSYREKYIQFKRNHRLNKL